MSDVLMDSHELSGCVLPPPILQYCIELCEQWRSQGDLELAIMATEAGMLVCSPAIPQRATVAMNNVKQLLQMRIESPVVMAFASASNIRLLLQEAERGNGITGVGGDKLQLSDVTRAQQTLTDLVSEALVMGASDIHLRFEPALAWVNFRVKGRLIGAQRRSREAMVESIAAALNTYSEDFREVFSEQRCDSASIELQVPGNSEQAPQQVRLRLQKSPLNHGFAVTLRLLPERPQQSFSLTELAMAEDVRAGLTELLRHQHGLIIIAGATGQGKTTTLAALNHLLLDKKVISLEDPIEIVQAQIEQRWVDAQQQSFAEHIKMALREDPDVISISEIRDTQTAQAAVMAALTGHLVTATIHAHDCIGAIQRLVNLGVNLNELIAEGVLQGVVAQHLVHANESTQLLAEYVLLDYPARRYLRRQDYSGWRTHLQSHGWRSMSERWRERHPQQALLHEPAQCYEYQQHGPYRG